MKKLLLLGFLSMFVGSQAQAGFISVINGADMAGIEVTATFADASTETLTWEALSSDSGGVSGTGWSLTQEGETFGEFDGTDIIGAWTIVNDSDTLVSLFINLLDGFVFDTAYGDDSANGSGNGRELVASDLGLGVAFGDNFDSELYSTLMLTNIDLGETSFLIDTDLVSAPATISILTLSLFGLVMSARRKQA